MQTFYWHEDIILVIVNKFNSVNEWWGRPFLFPLLADLIRDGAVKWNTWTARAAVASNFVVATVVARLSSGVSQTVFLVASFSRTVVRHPTTGRHIPVQLSSLFIYCAPSV